MFLWKKIANLESKNKLVLILLFTSLIAYALSANFIVNLYIPDKNGYTSREQVFGDDFINMWAGSKLVLEGKITGIYDNTLYNLELKKLIENPDYNQHVFSYPPHLLILIPYLGFFTYFHALLLFSALGISSVIALMYATKAKLPWIFILLTSPAVIANLIMGQNGLFTGVLLILGLLLCRQKPIIAGLIFSLLTIKPQLGILIPFILIITKNWKCLLSSTLGTCSLIGLSFVLFGWEPWEFFLKESSNLQTQFLSFSTQTGLYYQFMMPGIYANIFFVSMPIKIFIAGLHAIASIFAIYKIYTIVKADPEFTSKTILSICLASALITPYFFSYDLTAVVIAALFYLIESNKTGRDNHIINLTLLAVWTLPLTTLAMRMHFLNDDHAVVSPFFIIPSLILFSCFYLVSSIKNKTPHGY